MEKAFLNSIDEHQKMVYKICSMYRDTKEDREDLFQEIVYQLWKAYPSFRGASKISTWIYRIALNTAMTAYRKSAPSINYVSELPEREQQATGNIENEERLYWILRQLTGAEKALISLYLEGCSYQEIAEVIGISETNVGARLNRIKNKLKNSIQS